MQANRFARVCYEEAFKYAHRRRTFGKPLVEHPVIRAKLADMVRQIDATHAQMENITYQMCTMTKEAGRDPISIVIVRSIYRGYDPLN